MKTSQIARASRRNKQAPAGLPIEALEARTLLSAAVTSAISNITVPAGTGSGTIDLNSNFTDSQVTGTTVLIQTSNGNIPIELLDTTTPATVTNFLNYVNSGRYNNTIIHRSVPGFIIQGGGYLTNGQHITQDAPVVNEFHVSNTRGTVAMAKLGGDANSATSEWFINEADNSSNLDAQNGGFTVFAKVIYNGMAVADAIQNLPTINGSSVSSAWTNLPVQKAAKGTATSNLVVLPSVRVVPHLSYSVTSDNRPAVTPTIAADGHTLSLVYGPGGGTAHLTVTATDLGGNAVSQRFTVNVGAAAPTTITLGTGGVKLVSFKQGDGATVKVSLKGPGSASLDLAGSGLTQSTKKGVTTISGAADAQDITVTGSTAATVLSITATGGPKTATLGGLTISGPLGQVLAKSIDLTGNLSAAGSVKSIQLHSASGAAMNIGATGTPLTLKSTGTVTDESITSASPIASITAPNWTATTAGGSTITAPSIANIAIKGTLTNTTITTSGAVGKVTVGGAASGSTINAGGNITSVSAASLLNSTILAGVSTLPSGQPLPNFPTDFANNASIGSVKLKTSKTAASDVNSNIAAETLGKLTLGKVQFNNSGSTFGVAGHTIAALAGQDSSTGKKFSFKKLTSATDLQALLTKAGLTLVDFVIKLF